MRYKIFSEGTGLKVSELALGTGMFGQACGYGAPPEEVRRIIVGFADAGGNFIDTADNYQHGVSEALVGEAIAANRDDFVIATKFTRGASAKPALTRLATTGRTWWARIGQGSVQDMRNAKRCKPNLSRQRTGKATIKLIIQRVSNESLVAKRSTRSARPRFE